MSPSRSPNRRRNSSERSTSAAITQRKSIGDLLFVSGKIDNFNTHLFVDCGSSISLISHHIYQQFQNKNPIVQSTIKLQTASQQPLKVLGKTTVNIEINGTTRKEGTFATAYEFYVAEELAHNILLGIDFLRTFGANIDTENNKLILKADNASTVHKCSDCLVMDRHLKYDWTMKSPFQQEVKWLHPSKHQPQTMQSM